MTDKINILVVDDRPEGLLAIQAVLDDPQYNLVFAHSGKEALKQLLNGEYAVILLDVQMPVMNGFETAEYIKTRESSKDIPIIFMSAINQDEQYVYQGYKVGAVEYLLKPFDPYILRSKVAIFVEMFKKNALIREQARRLFEIERQNHIQNMDRIELDSLRRYRTLADSLPQIVFKLTSNGDSIYFNKVWFETTGLIPDNSLNRGWKNVIHPEDLKNIEENLSSPSTRFSGFENEVRLLNKDGELHWYLFRFRPDPMATDYYWIGSATDIQDRRRNEETQRFLAEVGELLISSLDCPTLLTNLAAKAVPYLADWCSVDLLHENSWNSVAVVHRNPEKAEILRKLQGTYFFDPTSEHGLGGVVKTGKTQVIALINPKMFQNSEELGDKSAVFVPILSRGEVKGVLTFVFSGSGRRYDDGYIKIAEDLGRRASLALENANLYQLSQQAIELRNEFFSIASHELNTPITSLKLHLQMTKKTLASGDICLDRFSHSIQASVKQVDRLIKLIEVLLDISRIQAGKLSFNIETQDLAQIVKDLCERFMDVINAHNCHLHLYGLESVKINCDKMRIEQVIINLLMNAVKYAPGKIDLTLRPAEGGVNIFIKDYGDGIPEEKISTIFDRFERASANKSVSGLGLGLFIVKQIVEGHHGKVHVSSQKGQGTQFQVYLPANA